MMGYNRVELFKKAKQVTEENNLFFIEDIVSLLPCDKTTFYKHFPLDSHELNELKKILELNRVSLKVKMRKKWEDNPAPALQMALMKLICTEDERKKLSVSYTDITTGGEKVITGIIEL